MAVRIDGIVHATYYPGKTVDGLSPLTRCGLNWTGHEHFKTWLIDCERCKELSHRAFMQNWANYEAKHGPVETLEDER